MSEKERADMIKELLALADESVVEEQETKNDNQPATDKKEEKSTKEDKTKKCNCYNQNKCQPNIQQPELLAEFFERICSLCHIVSSYFRLLDSHYIT